MTVSTIVLIGGKYDEILLKRCLDLVKWADEIIKVETDELSGSFSEWRNYGAQKATGDWLFYVDSDEEVSKELREEIEIELEKERFCAYAIPRKNILLGKEMKHGGWKPDYVLRLIKKEALIKWEGELHERPEIKGEIGKLKQALIHTSHRTLTEMVEKTNKWSEIEGDLLFKSNHPKMNLIRFISVALREFFLRFVKELCFLDGKKGIIYGIYQIYSRLISYSKLWEKQLSTIRT